MFFSFIFQVKPQQINNKYRRYSPTQLTNAYLAYKSGNVSLRGAARQYGVPVQTLRDRTSGKISIDVVKSGKAPVFSLEEEARLVNHLKEMAALGYGYTRREVVDIANDYALTLRKRDKKHPLTIRWYQCFMSRWDADLKLVKPRALEIQRAKAGTIESVNSYFDELTGIIEKYDLKDKPHLIFNVDEKGIQQNHIPPSVVAGNTLAVQEVVSSKSSTTTILGCGNAAGMSIPPYFVFEGARMRQELMAGKTPGADGTVSPTGWSNTEIFRGYIEDHFLKYAPGRDDDPILLLLDGHKSHTTIGIVDWAKEHNIILYILPAHTSHFLQPLDVGCYGPFHRIFSNECHKETRTLSTVITRYNICEIACRTYTKALSPDNLRHAFRRTGIFPLDRAAINSDYLIPAQAFINPDDIDVTEKDDTEEDNDETSTDKQPHENIILVPDTFELVVDENNNDTINGPGGDSMDIVPESESNSVVPDMTGDFFTSRVDRLKMIKSEKETKSRNTLSKITSGHCITEDNIRDKIAEHQSTAAGKSKIKPKVNSKGTTLRKKRANDDKEVSAPSKKVGKRKQKKAKQIDDSQIPGPSNWKTTHDYQDSETESEDENAISEDEKCCVCKLFTPKEVRESPCLIFTKWAQCDSCQHWVHLIYCTTVRVIRKGDQFLCHHCKTE